MPPRRRSTAGRSPRQAWRRCRRVGHGTAFHRQTVGTGAEGRVSSSRSEPSRRNFPLPPAPPASTAAAPRPAGRSPYHAAAGLAETGNGQGKQLFRPKPRSCPSRPPSSNRRPRIDSELCPVVTLSFTRLPWDSESFPGCISPRAAAKITFNKATHPRFLQICVDE